MSFAELGLADEIVRAVRELGYETPTPIQRQAIPAVLEGGDLLAGAQTGTGKTAGFTLPILHRLATNPLPNRGTKPVIRALILAPTRELAAQVEESVRQYGKYLKLKSMMMFGGVGINPQIDQLRKGVDIVVATPGRLLDHLQQKTIDLSHIEIFVLDEADRMLDMGFIRDIRKVLAVLPRVRQNLLFSATFAEEIKQLADDLLNKPAMIEVARRNTTAETVSQKIHPVDRDKKRELLTHLIREHNWFQVLVFTRTKHGANRLAEQLSKDGISAMAIHGNKSQSARTRALAEFKDASLQVLVATDIAARGIDIDQLEHVVNYDLPNVPEDYVHRIGRTGRAGATGEAMSLVCVDEHQLLADIERVIKRSLPREVIPGFEPDPNARPEPIQRRSGGGQREGQRGGQGSGQKNGGQRRNASGGNHEARSSQGGQRSRPNPNREDRVAGQTSSQGSGRGAGSNAGSGGNAGTRGDRDGRPAHAHGGQRTNGDGRAAQGGDAAQSRRNGTSSGNGPRGNAPRSAHSGNTQASNARSVDNQNQGGHANNGNTGRPAPTPRRAAILGGGPGGAQSKARPSHGGAHAQPRTKSRDD